MPYKSEHPPPPQKAVKEIWYVIERINNYYDFHVQGLLGWVVLRIKVD